MIGHTQACVRRKFPVPEIDRASEWESEFFAMEGYTI
jgi:hypothetical protein